MFDLCKEIKAIRDTDPSVEWLKNHSMNVLRKSAEGLSVAYQKFFKKQARAPRFKSRFDRRSFRIDCDDWSRVKIRRHSNTGKYSYLKLEQFPKLLSGYLAAQNTSDEGIFNRDRFEEQCRLNGLLKVRFDDRVPLVDGVRQWPGRVSEISFSADPSGKWYVSFLCEVPHKRSNPGKSAVVGLDMGIKSQVVASDGTVLENLRVFKSLENKLARWQRKMARRRLPKGTPQTKRYLYAKRMVAKVYDKMRCIREHHTHCFTTDLVRRYRAIVIEDLAVSNMVKNHSLAKAISDVSLRRIREQLVSKVQLDGITSLMIADRWYPSSHICHTCGKHVGRKLQLPVRGWTCPHCGIGHDRDFNASKNLEQLGIKYYSEAHKLLGGTILLPSFVA
jgi:IS605 OrfB family transposase